MRPSRMTTVARGSTFPGSVTTRASRTANTVGRRAPGPSAAEARSAMLNRKSRPASTLRLHIDARPFASEETEGEPAASIKERTRKGKQGESAAAGGSPVVHRLLKCRHTVAACAVVQGHRYAPAD